MQNKINLDLNYPLYKLVNVFMHELCLHKIGPDKSDQAIGPELQNAGIFYNKILKNITF